MSKFAMDLAAGKNAEKRVATKLLKDGLYKAVNFVEGNFSAYDAIGITPEGKEEKLEMKNDMKSALTGNFFVEFWCGNNASGIDTTEADYYVVTTHKPMQHWKLPVKYIAKLAKDIGKIVSGGDDSKARGYLVPVSKLNKEYCLGV